MRPDGSAAATFLVLAFATLGVLTAGVLVFAFVLALGVLALGVFTAGVLALDLGGLLDDLSASALDRLLNLAGDVHLERLVGNALLVDQRG